MVDAPEKIWADNDGGWHSNDCSEVLPCIEYVRADIAELAARRFRATEIRLERERDRERKHVGRLMREKEELRTQSDKFCDKYLAALKRAETAERQPAERDAEVARVKKSLTECANYIASPLRLSDDNAEAARRDAIVGRAHAVLAGSDDAASKQYDTHQNGEDRALRSDIASPSTAGER